MFLGEGSPVLSYKTWVGVVPGAITCPTPQFAFASCDVAATMVQTHSGPDPLPQENPPIIHQPNSRYCKVCQMYCNHPNGCNVLMGDGSVRFATMYINTYTWHALATRAGGEVIAPINTNSEEDPDHETVAHPASGGRGGGPGHQFSGPVVTGLLK